ncbi:MAG: DNA recombination protein RmuC, partial [Epsilonproteobacteria bacterium]|nr:DNA recombination protein RmuC [Campylobacterota bacterium]
SLVSYSKAIECEDEKEKEKYIRAHRASIKRHIDELAAKNYHKLSQLKAPEFTLMFIPIEGAYIMALESDPQLFEYAFERGVAVVTPPTLFTTLKTISQLWKLAKQDENMAALAREAANLHDKFVAFYEEFLTIKSKLLNAIDAWESADSKIKNGRGNILSKIEKIGKLSGKTKKELKYEKEEI